MRKLSLLCTLLLSGILCCSCGNTTVIEMEGMKPAAMEESGTIDSIMQEELSASDASFDLNNGYYILEDISREEFIDAYVGQGSSEQEPVYSYYGEDGKLQMELYYDVTAQQGCGIRYFYYEDHEERKGFVLEACENASFRQRDVNAVRTIDEIVEQDSWIQVSDCDEAYEYDDAGRLLSYEATGIAYSEEIEEAFYSGDACWLTTTEFEYWENGVVSKKEYMRNMAIWGQIGQHHTEYYDTEERLTYEAGYASPGYYEFYYIYENDSDIPVYAVGCDETQMIHQPRIIIYSNK